MSEPSASMREKWDKLNREVFTMDGVTFKNGDTIMLERRQDKHIEVLKCTAISIRDERENPDDPKSQTKRFVKLSSNIGGGQEMFLRAKADEYVLVEETENGQAEKKLKLKLLPGK